MRKIVYCLIFILSVSCCDKDDKYPIVYTHDSPRIESDILIFNSEGVELDFISKYDSENFLLEDTGFFSNPIRKIVLKNDFEMSCDFTMSVNSFSKDGQYEVKDDSIFMEIYMENENADTMFLTGNYSVKDEISIDGYGYIIEGVNGYNSGTRTIGGYSLDKFNKDILLDMALETDTIYVQKFKEIYN